MPKAHKVTTTKVRQQGIAVKQPRPGKPVNGPNLVPQHAASAKKAARRGSDR